MQTRLFETADERELLSASTAVLQDLGFHVEEVVRAVGLVRAVKERSARQHGQDIGRFIVMVLTFCYVRPAVDLHQKISAVVVTSPLKGNPSRHEVRVTFYRVVWKGEGYVEREGIPPGDQRMEMIDDPEIYQRFFAGLSQAVFLEGFKL